VWGEGGGGICISEKGKNVLARPYAIECVEVRNVVNW
jgi:hypothetical protein